MKRNVNKIILLPPMLKSFLFTVARDVVVDYNYGEEYIRESEFVFLYNTSLKLLFDSEIVNYYESSSLCVSEEDLNINIDAKDAYYFYVYTLDGQRNSRRKPIPDAFRAS